MQKHDTIISTIFNLIIKSISMLKKYLEKAFNNYMFITVLFVLYILIVPFQHYLTNKYNNFTIFQHSSFHFFQKVNLYLAYPKEYYDVFLYNPTFSFLFTPIAYIPTILGIFIWGTFITGLFYYAVRLLPLDKKSNLFILYFTFPELITSVQNLQTNSIIAASILLAFIFLEKRSTFKSSFFVNIGFFIKVYGAVSGAFYILKTPRLKSLLYLLIWFLVLLSLPLLFYSPGQFVVLYKQWIECLSNDHDINSGLSVMSFMAGVFNYLGPVYYTQFVGVFMLLITMLLIALKKTYEEVKFFFLAYIMIWVVIFNHASESATYIIASTGAAIWYVNSKKTILDKILIITTFILTVMSPSDLFPSYLRTNFVKPYSLKVLGPMLIFIKIQISFVYNYVKSGHNSTAVQST
jgi:hypothetical protein